MLWVAHSEKDTATDALEKRLWDAADQLWANSGRDYIVTLTTVLSLMKSKAYLMKSLLPEGQA